jgi:hypothetical protein
MLWSGGFFCLLGYRQDLKDEQNEARGSGNDLQHVSPEGAPQKATEGSNTGETSPAQPSDTPVHPKLQRNEKALLQASLPAWARSKGFLDMLLLEMGRRHDWFSIVMVYSRVYPRPFRIALIFTSTIALM